VSERDDGGPAFPYSYEITGVDSEGYASKGTATAGGMSLRDYFAGQVIAACIDMLDGEEMGRKEWVSAASIAAYRIADAMLIARQA